MIVGKLVESAVIGLKQTLIASDFLKENYTPSEFQKACADYIEKFGAFENFQQVPATTGHSLG